MVRWSIFLALFVVAGLMGCKSKEEVKATKAVPVKVLTVKPDSLTTYIEVTGGLEAGRDALVVSKTSERLIQILKPVGSRVKENEVIARLDSKLLKQVKNQAKAGLKSARARFENVKNDYERYRKLYQSRAISIQQWQKMQSAMQEAQAGLEQMEAAYAQAKEQYENSFIKAPFSGIVGSIFFDPGQMVPMGQPVAKIVNPKLMKAKLYVPDIYFKHLKIGQKVQASFPVLPDKTFIGKIIRIDSAIDPMSRTVMAEVTFDNKENELTSGLYGLFKIKMNQKQHTIVLPDNALLSRTVVKVDPQTGRTYSMRKNFVFVVQADSAKLVQVQKGLSYRDRVEISKGLNFGDRVVVIGQFLLKDGEKVKIANDFN